MSLSGLVMFDSSYDVVSSNFSKDEITPSTSSYSDKLSTDPSKHLTPAELEHMWN